MRPGGVSQGSFLECILFVLHSELFFEVDLPAVFAIPDGICEYGRPERRYAVRIRAVTFR